MSLPFRALGIAAPGCSSTVELDALEFNEMTLRVRAANLDESQALTAKSVPVAGGAQGL